MSVKITDILEPKYGSDTYALLEDIYFKGGFRVVTNTIEMEAITEQRRKDGMFVYNLEDKKLYTLNGGKFEIYEVSGLNEEALFNLIKSQDDSIFEVLLNINNNIILVPKIKELKNLSYISKKSYPFEETEHLPFSEIIIEGITFSTVQQDPQGNQTKTENIIIKEENNMKYASINLTDVEFPAWADPGLGEDEELNQLLNKYMLLNFGESSGGTSSEKEVKAIMPLVKKIEDLEETYSGLTDAQLQAKTPEFKARLQVIQMPKAICIM